MIDQEPYNWSLFRRFLQLTVGIGVLLILLGYLYRSIMIGLVSSGVITYIFAPAVDYLSDHLGLQRKILVGILILLVITICGLAAVFGLPFIYHELIHIVQMIPNAIVYGEQLANPLLEWLKHTKIVPPETLEGPFRKLNLLQNFNSGMATDTLQQLFSQTPKVLEVVFNLVLVPLLTYRMLCEKNQLRKLVKSWVPSDLHTLIQIFVTRIDHVLRAVVKGQFLVAMILSIFYMVGFTLIDLPSGIAIGAIAGICRIVPYLDVMVALGLSLIVLLTQGSGLTVFLAVLIVVAVVQSLDGMIITPRIIGDRAGLHPIVVLTSVFCFGNWFGLLGVLLAVPVVGAAVVALQICRPYLQSSPFYRQPPS